MRKGFDGLSGIVREHFGADPTSGSLYLFINRRRDRAAETSGTCDKIPQVRAARHG